LQTVEVFFGIEEESSLITVKSFNENALAKNTLEGKSPQKKKSKNVHLNRMKDVHQSNTKSL